MATTNKYHHDRQMYGQWVKHMDRESWLPECPTILPIELADSRDWSLIGWSKVCPEVCFYEIKLIGPGFAEAGGTKYHYIIKQFNDGGGCTWDVTRMEIPEV